MLVDIQLDGHEIVVVQLEDISSIENVIKHLDYHSFNVVDMRALLVHVLLEHSIDCRYSFLRSFRE